MCAFSVNLGFHTGSCVCVSKACVCPLFTLQCCLVQCWCMWSLLRAFIVDRYRFDKSRAQNNGLWLEKRSVSLSSKTPDQSDGVKKRMTHSSLLCPLSLSLSLSLSFWPTWMRRLSPSEAYYSVTAHSKKPTVLTPSLRSFIPVSDPLCLFFRATVQIFDLWCLFL